MDARASWYFDFVSPFAYLQWRRLQRLPLTGLIHRPVLFAGLLNHLGHKGPAEIPAKRVFTYRQVVWRAERDSILLRFPPAHPFNPLPALRLCVATGTTVESIDTVFRHIWEEGNAVEDAGEIEALARRLGLSGAAPALADKGVQRVLRDNFSRALGHQVFGVPTIVCDGQLFWGDDATDMFIAYLRDPALFQSERMLRVARLPIGTVRPRAM